MTRNIILNIFIITLWILLGIAFAIIIWGMNKGFDLSDEGFNMLLFTHGQECAIKYMPFYSIFNNIFQGFKPGILFYRMLRLGLLLLSSTIFYWGFKQWIQYTLKVDFKVTSFYILYPIICISTLMSYSIFYQTLSYNSLNLVLTQLTVGFFLLYLSEPFNIIKNRKRRWIFLFIVSFLAGTILLIKFTTALLVLSIIILILIIEIIGSENNKKENAINIITSFISGFIFYCILTTIIGYSPVKIIQGIITSLPYIPGHGVIDLLKMYCNDLVVNFILIVLYHPVYFVGPVILWWGFGRIPPGLNILIIGLTVFFIIADVLTNHFYKAGMTNLYSASAFYRLLLLFSFIFIILVLLFKRTRLIINETVKEKNNFYAGLFLLVAFPILCSFGTDGVLSVNITQNIFSWGLIFLLIILIILSKEKHGKAVFLAISLLLICNSVSQIYSGYIKSPYRLNGSLYEQQYKVPELARSNNILFDLKTAYFLKKTVTLFNDKIQYSDEQPIINLYNYPGLTYLLGGVSPGQPWYWPPAYENNDFINCYYLSKSEMKNLENTIIILESSFTVTKTFRNGLLTKGIVFPDNYKLIDSIAKPFGAGKLFVYSPKCLVKK
jgi:hypothetical protein